MSHNYRFSDLVEGLAFLGTTGGLSWMIYTFADHVVKMEERKSEMEEKKLRHDQCRDNRR
jgi:hypothetical protein